MNPMNSPISQLPLGQNLLARGVVSQDQLNIALTEQRKLKTPLGKILVQLGFATEATIRDTLSESLAQRPPQSAYSFPQGRRTPHHPVRGEDSETRQPPRTPLRPSRP